MANKTFDCLIIILCVFDLVRLNLCANILAITTLASPSHHLWHKAYYSGLLEKGHNITVLGHDEEKEKTANFTMLTLEGVYDKIHDDFVLEDLVQNGPFQSIGVVWDWDFLLCKYDSETKAFEKLMNYPKNYKFDLIIWDINGGRCLYPLIDKFGRPPVIATSPFGLHSYIDYIFDFFLMPREYELSKKLFGNEIRTMDEFERDMSLLIANSDPLAYYPQPVPPNIIPVAGIHIRPTKKLPDDIQKILNGAKHGVVLVIFGTNLNWNKFGEVQRQAFFKTFEKLPQTILVKAPDLQLKLSKNVIVREWLPQSDILAHPNVKLFITHGGALSTQEAFYHGVPVVGMPFYLDQHGNMNRIVALKLGKKIDYLSATFSSVHTAITEVLNNSVYRSNMKSVSKKFRDQPQTPLERAVFWTEYVLRHGAAENLNPSSRDMSMIERFDLDITGIIVAIVIFVLVVFYKLIGTCGRMFFPKRILISSSKLKSS